MQEKQQKRENWLRVTLYALILIFATHVGTSLFRRAQLDLTEEQIYSLSDGTKKILEKVSTPIELKLYYSKTAANKGSEGIRTFNTYFRYVRDLLEEYVSYGNNRLSLQVIDPRPDTEEESEAQAYGLKKFNLTETETYFFGLVVENESGSEKIIEFFDPSQQSKLEYQLTKLIYQVMNPSKKNLGILSSLPVIAEDSSPYMAQLMRMQGKSPEQSWLISELLKETYNVRSIDSDADTIQNLDVLLVIQPGELPEQTLFAMDQFLMKGGKLLILNDPLYLVGQQQQSPFGGAPQKGSNIDQILTKWGVEVSNQEIAGDLFLAQKRPVAPGYPPQKIIQLLDCRGACGSSESIITNNVDEILFMAPGVVKTKELEGIETTTLLQTTEKGNTYQKQQAMGPPQMLAQSFSEGSSPITFGVMAKGMFESNFPEGITYEKDGEGESKKKEKVTLEAEPVSKKEGALIVIGDVDFISNQVAFRETMLGVALANENSSLLMNAVDQLAGSSELLSIRSKGNFSRPFEVIEEIEQQAEQATAAQVEKINQSIQRFRQELSQIGRAAGSSGNVALLKNEAIKRKKQLNIKIAQLQQELRQVKRQGREKIERLGSWFQYLNTMAVPILLLIAAFLIFNLRKKKVQQLELKEQNA